MICRTTFLCSNNMFCRLRPSFSIYYPDAYLSVPSTFRTELGNLRRLPSNLRFFLCYHSIRFPILFLYILSIWESNSPIPGGSRWSDPLLVNSSATQFLGSNVQSLDALILYFDVLLFGLLSYRTLLPGRGLSIPVRRCI
jgi:hypothetical protein